MNTRQMLRPYRRRLAAATIVICCAITLELASPWPLAFAIDYAVGGRPPRGWLSPLSGLSTAGLAAVAAGVSVALAATGAALTYLTRMLVGIGGERMSADVRQSLLDRLLTLSLRFHDRHRGGELITRLTGDIARLENALVSWFITVVPDSLSLVGMTVILLLVDPTLGLVALAVIPLLVAVAMVRRRLMRRAQRVARARTGELSAETLELLRSVRAIQAFGQERLAGERFATANRANLSAQITAMKVSARLSPIAGMIIAVDAAAVLFLGVVAVGDGRMSVGTLLALLAYVPGLHEPVSSLTSLAGTFATAQVSRERLSEVFDSTDVLPEPEQPRSAGPLSHGIEVCGLSFAYEDREPVLRDLTLRVGVGETVCVVGPSGAGKSTLLALLARLHDPDGGSIRYDGVDLRQFELASLRGRVAMLPQDTWLIDGSLEDNIAFGRAGTSPREVRAASALALVDEFAERLPDGYRTRVGEGGVLLSGGQRRRIALARAVLRNADVLLLDEPTSGLDAASEALVLSALRRIAPGRTVLVVSHRLTLATHADRVVVLDGGRVVEHGPPGALRARGGAYDRLCRLLEPPAA